MFMIRTLGIVAAGLLLLSGTIGAAEIHDAAKAGDLAKAQALLRSDPALVNTRDDGGRTPLHWACWENREDLIRILVEAGADVNAADSSGVAPLHGLAARGHTEAARFLIDRGANANLEDQRNKTPLHLAAENGQEAAVRLLLDKGAQLEKRDLWGRTVLIAAARERGGVAVVRILLDAGADTQARDKGGDSALDLAAWRGFADEVDLLLERGAEVSVAGQKGRQLMSFATSKGLTALFRRLADAGVDLTADLGGGRTWLHSAAAGGSVSIVEALLARGLDVNTRDSFGWTPLQLATDMGRQPVVELLLARGADMALRNRLGQSAFNLARENGDTDLANLLAARGADPGPPHFPDLCGPFLGQRAPGAEPELFAPGIVWGRYNLHSSIAFSPDGREAHWAVSIPPRGSGYGSGRTYTSRQVNGRWTYPEKAEYDGITIADVPYYSPDGSKLYDVSSRKTPDGREGGKENIWVWERGNGGWTNPQPVDPAVNELPLHWQFGLNGRHDLYLSLNIVGSKGAGDIFVSRCTEGKYGEPEPLGDTINTAAGEMSPFVAPDDGYLLFSRDGDLYVSFRDDNHGWGVARKLEGSVNTPDFELCPMVSPDGSFLFFLRGGRQFWVDAGVVEALRPVPPAGRPADEAAIRRSIRNSIGWARDKDTKVLYDCLAQDADFFIFHPDSGSTVVGFDAFRTMVEAVFLSERFQALNFIIRDLRVNLSRGGDTAWFSALLDDWGLWGGKPAGWDGARWTGVLERRDDRWVIVQMHFSLATDRAPSGTAPKEVWDTVLAFCRTWAGEANAEGLRNYFHPDVITASPARRDRLEGLEANVQAYREFLASTKVLGWKLGGEKILLLGPGDVAVADFEYDITMEKDQRTIHATGRDTMVLVRRAGRWQIVADHFSGFPPEDSP